MFKYGVTLSGWNLPLAFYFTQRLHSINTTEKFINENVRSDAEVACI